MASARPPPATNIRTAHMDHREMGGPSAGFSRGRTMVTTKKWSLALYIILQPGILIKHRRHFPFFSTRVVEHAAQATVEREEHKQARALHTEAVGVVVARERCLRHASAVEWSRTRSHLLSSHASRVQALQEQLRQEKDRTVQAQQAAEHLAAQLSSLQQQYQEVLNRCGEQEERARRLGDALDTQNTQWEEALAEQRHELNTQHCGELEQLRARVETQTQEHESTVSLLHAQLEQAIAAQCTAQAQVQAMQQEEKEQQLGECRRCASTRKRCKKQVHLLDSQHMHMTQSLRAHFVRQLRSVQAEHTRLLRSRNRVVAAAPAAPAAPASDPAASAAPASAGGAVPLPHSRLVQQRALLRKRELLLLRQHRLRAHARHGADLPSDDWTDAYSEEADAGVWSDVGSTHEELSSLSRSTADSSDCSCCDGATAGAGIGGHRSSGAFIAALDNYIAHTQAVPTPTPTATRTRARTPRMRAQA